MKGTFIENRPFIEHEYEQPNWDLASGYSAEQMYIMLTKFVDENLHLPMPILRAKAFDYFLENVQIEINPHTYFADKLNLGVDYSDYAGQDVFANCVYHRFHKRVLEKEMPDDFARRNLAEELGVCTADSDYWHTLPEWTSVLELGFCGLLERAQKKRNNLKGNLSESQIIFYDSVIISYQAIIKYINRLYEASLKYDFPEYSACLKAISERAPENMYEVLETSLIYMNMEEIGVERARSLGRIDQMYYPYYRHDIDSGIMSLEEMKELIRYFYLKLQAGKRYADQPFSIGGVNENGEDATNDLSYLLLDVYDGLKIHNPKIHICYHENLPLKLIKQVLDLIRRGNSSFVLINGEAVIKGYEKIGIPEEESRLYVPFGCYEPILQGKEEPMIGASWLNMPKAIEFALNSGVDMKTNIPFGPRTSDNFESYDDFYQAFLLQLKYIIEFTKDNILKQDRYHMQINPSPVYSGSITSCIEKGKDIFDGGTKYHNTSIKCCGIATVVDSLLMVKKYVYDEKKISFKELREALLNNWKGYEKLRLMIRKDRLKYGNHIKEADMLSRDVYKYAAELIVNQKNNSGGVFRMGCDSITNCIVFGRRMGATPDGRMYGEATSKNFCATNGMDREGVTAYIQSVTAMDSSDFVNGAVMDFILHPSMVQGDAGLDAMYKMVKTYFDLGGYAIQGNVMDIEMLKEAQKNPEEYKTLQVRVCGWNEYFVEMSHDVQEEFIKQLEGVK